MKKQTKIVVLLLTLALLLVGVAFAVSAADGEPASAEATHYDVTVKYTIPGATETTVKIEYVPAGTTLLRALEEKSIYYIATSSSKTTVVFVDRASHAIYNAVADKDFDTAVNADTTVDGNITVQLTNIAAVDTTNYPVFYDVVRSTGIVADEATTQTADGFKAAIVNGGDRVIILTLTDNTYNDRKILEPSLVTSTREWTGGKDFTQDMIIDLNGYTLDLGHAYTDNSCRWTVSTTPNSRFIFSNGKITNNSDGSRSDMSSLLFNSKTNSTTNPFNVGLFDFVLDANIGVVRSRCAVNMVIKGSTITYGSPSGYSQFVHVENKYDIDINVLAYNSTFTAGSSSRPLVIYSSAQSGDKTLDIDFAKCTIDIGVKLFTFSNTFKPTNAKVSDGELKFTDCKIKASGLDNSSESANALIYPVTFNNTKTSFNPLTKYAYSGMIKDCAIYDNEDADKTTYPFLVTVPEEFGSVTVKLDGEVIFSQDEVGAGTSLATLLSGKANELAERSIYVGSNGKVIYTKYNVADGTSDGNVYVADLSEVVSEGEEFIYEINGTPVDEDVYPYFYAFNPDTGDEVEGISGDENNTALNMMKQIIAAKKCVIILTNDLLEDSYTSDSTNKETDTKHKGVGSADHIINMNGHTLTLHMYTESQRYFAGSSTTYLLTYRDGILNNTIEGGKTSGGAMFYNSSNSRFVNVKADLTIGLVRGRGNNFISIENSDFNLKSDSQYGGGIFLANETASDNHKYSANLENSKITFSGDGQSLFTIHIRQEDKTTQEPVNINIDNCIIDTSDSTKAMFTIAKSDKTDADALYASGGLADDNEASIIIKDTDIKTQGFINGSVIIPMTITNTKLNKSVLHDDSKRSIGVNGGFVWQMPNDADDAADYPFYVNKEDARYAMVKWTDGTVEAWADGTLPYNFDCPKDVVKVVEGGKEYTCKQATETPKMKVNLTLYNDLTYNLLVLPGTVETIWFNGEVVESRGYKTVDDVRYDVYSFDNTPLKVFEYTLAHIEMANGEILFRNLSVVEYLEIMDATYAEKIEVTKTISGKDVVGTEKIAKVEGKEHVVFLINSIAYYCYEVCMQYGSSALKDSELFVRNSNLLPTWFSTAGSANVVTGEYWNNRRSPEKYGENFELSSDGIKTPVFDENNKGGEDYVSGATFVLASNTYIALQMVNEADMNAVTVYVNDTKCDYKQIEGVLYAVSLVPASELNRLDIKVVVNKTGETFVGKYGACNYTNFALSTGWYYSGYKVTSNGNRISLKDGEGNVIKDKYETEDGHTNDAQYKIYNKALQVGKGLTNYSYAVDLYLVKEFGYTSKYFSGVNK